MRLALERWQQDSAAPDQKQQGEIHSDVVSATGMISAPVPTVDGWRKKAWELAEEVYQIVEDLGENETGSSHTFSSKLAMAKDRLHKLKEVLRAT
jgi:hypothetical protein